MGPSIRQRVASNTAIQVAGKAAVLALGAASIAVLTRYLGPNDYGRFTLALMYMQLFGVLADAGLYMTVVREISKEPSRTDELVGNALTLRLLLSIVVIALGAALSLLLPYDPDVRLAIVLAGGPLLFGMLTSSLVTVLQSQLRMARAVAGEVAGRAFALGLTLVVALLDLGFYAVMGAAAGGAAATLAVTWLCTRGVTTLRFRAQPAVWRPLLVVSLPLGLALAINELYFRADTLIISLYQPYDEVGLYTLAYRILEFTLAFGTIFLTTVFPVLSEAVANDDPRALRTIQASTDLFVILGAPLVAGGLVLAPPIIELAGGTEFEGAATPLRVLLMAGALSWVNGVFGFALIAKGRQASALWLNVSALTFNVGLNFFLIPRYGIVAAAVVTVASEALILAGSYFLMRRNFSFFPRPGTLAPAVAAAAVMGGLLWLLRDASLAAVLPLAAALYAGLLYAISPRSREVLIGVRR
ncbi:MAG: flippase [Thermoleophilaceae bacterium]|nr:flippase [Thermoleophilaceae bacterium]